MAAKQTWDDRPELVRLVLQSHVVEEKPWPEDAPPEQDPEFVCRKDHQPWPCQSILKAEAYNQKQGRKDTQVLGNTPPDQSDKATGVGTVAARTNF